MMASLRSRVAPFAKSALFGMGGYTALRRLLPSRRAAILRYHAIAQPASCSYASPGICGKNTWSRNGATVLPKS